MKKKIILGVSFMALVGAVVGLVMSNMGSVQAAADQKIGTVNFQKALNDVEQGKRAKNNLKSEYESKKAKFKVQEEELKKLQAEIEKGKSTYSQDVLIQKQRSFQEKYLELQKNAAQTQQVLSEKEAKLASQILKNLKIVTNELGQKEGFTLIMENSQDAVLYVQSKEDLTERVVGLYNKKFTGNLKLDEGSSSDAQAEKKE